MNAGPTIHFASLSSAAEQVHSGPALCKAGRASRTEGDQYVSGDWAFVTCSNCRRILKAENNREDAAARAQGLRKEADRIEAEALKAERLKTADKIPTCPECGGRSFKIAAWTTVSQSIDFGDDDAAEGDPDGDWSDDYESGDHTDISASAECNGCGADVEEVLERHGWTFYDDPKARTEAQS